jgi:hypothetical protein
METLNDHMEILRRLLAYAFHPDTPLALAVRLQSIPGSDADKFIVGMETLYAHKDILNEAGLLVLGQLASFASGSGWGGLSERALAMFGVVRRDLGEIIGLDIEQDPEPEAFRRDDNYNWKDAWRAEQGVPADPIDLPPVDPGEIEQPPISPPMG